MLMESLRQSSLNRKMEAAKALVRMTFEHLPISSTPRMNVVDVSTRCHEIVAGTFPPDREDYEWTRYGGNEVVHTPPLENRWDDQGNYFDGARE